MGLLKRFLARIAETDEERLADEIKEWADSVPGTVRVMDAPQRGRVKMVGIVRRITIRPVEGFEALETVLWDGTGEISALWLGRRQIPGLALGSRLVVEGVVGTDRDGRKIVNPIFEFA